MARPAPPARIRPTPWWYLLVALLPLLGVAIGSLVVRHEWNQAKRVVRQYTRYPVNERGTVTFDEPGAFTMYFEGPAATVSVADLAVLVAKLDIRFTDAVTGQPVPLAPYRNNDGNRDVEAVAIKTFRIERPGDYVLEVRTSEFGRDEAGVSVGPSPFTGLVRGVAIALLALGVGVVGGIVAGVVVCIQRGRAKQSARPPPQSGWPPPRSGWPPPQSGWPPPQSGRPGGERPPTTPGQPPWPSGPWPPHGGHL